MKNVFSHPVSIAIWFIMVFLSGVMSVYAQQTTQPAPFVKLANSGNYADDIFVKQARPLPAGHTVEVPERMMNEGSWVKSSKQFIWKLGFYVPEAEGLNIYLSKLNLAVHDSLFLFTPGEKRRLVCTADQNKAYFATGFFPGDSLLLELHTWKRNIPFRIDEVGVANRYPGVYDRDFGGAGGCEVLVNCEEGDNWQQEKKGVARILVKEATNLFWCTGSLINNTNNDGTPYFLTANHCGQYASEADYNLWLFYFNYEAAGCEFPDDEPDKSQKILGAKMLANSPYDVDQSADFKLLLLNQEVPDSYGAFYNGWDRSGTVSASGVTIHHPQGDIKMISTYEQPLVSTEYDGSGPEPDGMYWKVTWAETTDGHGVTEGGSSGCPLFNTDGFVVGALTGGEASCSYPDNPDYYGKFSYAWESEGEDSTRQLKYWLDPQHTGVMSLKGTNLDTSSVLANFSSDVIEITVGEQVHFLNYSTGDIRGYKWSFSGGDPAASEMETPPPVTYKQFGTYDVSLIAYAGNGNDTLLRRGYIRVLPQMVPNPSFSGVFRFSFGKDMPEDVEFRLFDVTGREIGPFGVTKDDNSFYLDISRHAAGAYFFHLINGDQQQVVKAFYLKQ